MSMLHRRDVVRDLLRKRGDLMVVAGLGAPAYDLAACGDEALNFYLWGAMGGAAMVGLGLALAQPERNVLVLTGDGEMLMGLGSLATIAAQRLSNLRIVVLDNERYGETGGQTTHTSAGADLAAVACACGIPHVRTVRQADELAALHHDLHSRAETSFAVVKILPEDLPRVLPPRDGAFLTQRLRTELLGVERALEG
jgi:thiamine pyrophosphate-dependent acetolactate synthase large subunit-like protein